MILIPWNISVLCSLLGNNERSSEFSYKIMLNMQELTTHDEENISLDI